MDIVVAITLFVLALLIGVEVIGKVPATLHTPLMSGANSIHGIVIAGVVIVAAHATSPLAWVFIFLAAVLGTMNVSAAMSSPTACWRCSSPTRARRRKRRPSKWVPWLKC